MAQSSPTTHRREVSFLIHLQCSSCGKKEDAGRLVGTSACCDDTLYARYDLEAARERVTSGDVNALFGDAPGLWRYRTLLPDAGPRGPVTLAEGATPLVPGERSAGRATVLYKDESRNPTGTFKARGMAVAVTAARAAGATHLRAPTAGNAGGALATYAARGGLKATVAMPMDAPEANKVEVRAAGGRLLEVDGLIPDCAKTLAADAEAQSAFDVSTLREPYRMEGKKTMGFELWEQSGGRFPEVIVFPTGGGMGILALEKAHEELRALGLVDDPPPRLVAVQSVGCAPLVHAFDAGRDDAEPVVGPESIAGGIRVPTPKGAPLVLRSLRATRGCAIQVSEKALLEGMRRVARETGLLVSPEAGAAVAGLDVLEAEGHLDPGECVAVFLTGSGLKHLDLF